MKVHSCRNSPNKQIPSIISQSGRHGDNCIGRNHNRCLADNSSTNGNGLSRHKKISRCIERVTSAYLAQCIKNNAVGKTILENLNNICGSQNSHDVTRSGMQLHAEYTVDIPSDAKGSVASRVAGSAKVDRANTLLRQKVVIVNDTTINSRGERSARD